MIRGNERKDQNSGIDKRFILEMFSDEIMKAIGFFIDYSKLRMMDISSWIYKKRMWQRKRFIPNKSEYF